MIEPCLIANTPAPGPQLEAYPNLPSPSARTLAAVGRIGTLSTPSRKFSGFPFGSMVPFAADHRGRPVFFISSMAMHTQNLGRRPARSRTKLR